MKTNNFLFLTSSIRSHNCISVTALFVRYKKVLLQNDCCSGCSAYVFTVWFISNSCATDGVVNRMVRFDDVNAFVRRESVARVQPFSARETGSPRNVSGKATHAYMHK